MNTSNSNSMFQTVIQNIMNASRSTDNLCIIGEVGTGKRQAAASVNLASGKDEGRMSVFNCMALDHNNFLSDDDAANPDDKVKLEISVNHTNGSTNDQADVTLKYQWSPPMV